MRQKTIVTVWATTLLAVVFGSAALGDVRELSWDDLIPESEKLSPAQPPIVSHGAGGYGDEYGKGFNTPEVPSGVVESLNGEQVKIPGFIVPLEVAPGGKVSEFLLVPYFGACIHYPPPPPNQIVFVKMSDPVTVESPWDPVWVSGELTTKFQRSDLGSAGYTLAAEAIEEYEY